MKYVYYTVITNSHYLAYKFIWVGRTTCMYFLNLGVKLDLSCNEVEGEIIS